MYSNQSKNCLKSIHIGVSIIEPNQTVMSNALQVFDCRLTAFLNVVILFFLFDLEDVHIRSLLFS